MQKVDNLLFQKRQMEAKVTDLQLQIKFIEERIKFLQKHESVVAGTVQGHSDAPKG